MMLAFRFITGLLSPIAVIGKVLVTELCPNREVYKGMAMFGAGYIFGIVIGSFIGGFFNHSSWLLSFPYAFPFLLCSFLMIIILVFITLAIDE